MEFHDAFSRPYCVYGHVVNHDYVYIGSGTIARAFSVQRTKLWDKSTDGQLITVEIIEWFYDRKEALKCEIRLIQQYRPSCNQIHKGRRHPNRPGHRGVVNRAVKCVETGMLYPTSRAVCQAMNLSQGALSNVLNERGKTLRGFSFVRATDEENAAVLAAGHPIVTD